MGKGSEAGCGPMGRVGKGNEQRPHKGRAAWLAEAGWGLHPLREAVRDKVVRTVVGHQTASDRLSSGINVEATETGVQAARLAGVLTALVVGDQASIDRQDWDIFRTTGVAHLMSISGLHITLFAWLSGGLITALWRRSARWGSRACLALPARTRRSGSAATLRSWRRRLLRRLRLRDATQASVESKATSSTLVPRVGLATRPRPVQRSTSAGGRHRCSTPAHSGPQRRVTARSNSARAARWSMSCAHRRTRTRAD